MQMEEILDVVNENDEVVGQATRSDVHARGLMHRSVHIMLVNSSGRFFLQLRSRNKDTNPGLWDSSAAGHVDTGESYVDCAVRELAEELGLTVSRSDLTEIATFRPAEENGYEFVRVFTVCHDGEIILEANEIDDGKWLDPDELSRSLLEQPEQYASGFAPVWQAQLAFDKS